MKDAVIEEVNKLKETLSDPDEQVILNSLNSLKDVGAALTKQILKVTQVGFAVGKLRRHTNAQISSLAKELIGTWKEYLIERKKRLSMPVLDKNADFPGPCCEDVKRNRWRESLFKAFIEGLPRSQLQHVTAEAVGAMAGSIEDAVWEHYMSKVRDGGSANAQIKEYQMQLRSIRTNFRDITNPMFNNRVFLGVITPQELVDMPAPEMASDAKKAERRRARQESLEACQSDWDLRNIKRAAGQFPCGKCKSKNTTYIQIQTRSSDEPMTTYVTCTDCGHRWKF